MKLGVLYSRVRVEEKMLFEELDRRGVDYDKLDDRDAIFTLDDPRNWGQYDVILERCINHSRSPLAT